MPLILPFKPSVGSYKFTVPIGDAQYQFPTRWNTTDEAWYFDIAESDGTPIINGIKVVLGVPLGRVCPHSLFQSGLFICKSRQAKHLPPTFDNFGVAVEVLYFTRSEMALEMVVNASASGVDR